MKHILFIVATLALMLSACAPKTVPTVDPVQVQASAIAEANTMVVMTMAAIPTATPVPPTPVPSPTLAPSATPIPPTLSVQASPTTKSGGTSDPCSGPLVSNGGPDIKNVRISNENSEPIKLSLYLNKNAFAECGFRGFNIGPNQETNSTNLKAGCYHAAAIIGTNAKSFGNFCITDYTHGWWIKVMAEQIALVGP